MTSGPHPSPGSAGTVGREGAALPPRPQAGDGNLVGKQVQGELSARGGVAAVSLCREDGCWEAALGRGCLSPGALRS